MSTEKKCNCAICNEGREFYEHMAFTPPAEKEFYEFMYDCYLDASDSLDYYRAIVAGTYPGADETLSRFRGPSAIISNPEILVVPGKSAETLAKFDMLAEPQRTFFKKMNVKIQNVSCELNVFKNAVRNTLDNSDKFIANYRLGARVVCEPILG